jgi:hypothetical protein
MNAKAWSLTIPLILVTLVAALGAPGAAQAATGPRCYVNAGASGGNNGNFWTSAYTSLQSALTDPNCVDIWVAAGVYKPGTLVTHTFLIAPGRTVYGGFAGGETILDQRNPAANVTILSGDIDSNDTNADGNQINESYTHIAGSNSYHVVRLDGMTGDPVSPTTILSGFTITAGQAAGDWADSEGGGLRCDGASATHTCNPILANLIFSGNTAASGGAVYLNGVAGWSSPIFIDTAFIGNHADGGGAVYAIGTSGGISSPLFQNATFSTNTATNLGGALVNDSGNGGGTSSPSLTSVTFSNNSAAYGGAVYNRGSNGGNSSPSLSKVTFNGNSSTVSGGAMYDDGYNGGTSSPSLTNVTFYGNSAIQGGGALFNDGGFGGVSSPTLLNVTFNGNTAGNGGNAIFNIGQVGGTSQPTLTNVILWGDTNPGSAEIYNNSASPTISYSVVQGGCTSISGNMCGSGNLNTDPNLGPLQNNGGLTHTQALLAGSAAVNAGNDAICAGLLVGGLDQRGVSRPQGSHCDIGAYERLAMPPPADFDHDTDTDVSVFRSGTWFIRDQGVTGYGQAGDVPIAADYDGDGDSDLAVYRPSTGGWRVKDQFIVAYGGMVGDIPIPRDWDADGDCDVAIYRSSTAGWYIKDQFLVGYGLPSDIPVPGDYNGDGVIDVAVFRDGVWFIRNQGVIGWGQAGDIPIPGDYDGDGDTDLAVYRPSTGGWRVKDQFTVAYGGMAGDIPVPGDYDADGDTDVAIYRSSTAGWYIKDQFLVGYGLPGDWPVPAPDTNGDADPYQ